MSKARHFFTLLMIMPLFAFTQTKNYKDELGRKQGVHYDYSGSFLFERTYKNDTLNGYFRKYTQNGTTWETGYYKNGKKDSLWLEFYVDRTIESREFYKNGLKNGECISYFKNGHISYMATFLNDTVVGEEIHYYLNGSIRAKGNKTNGVWTEYFENGNVSLKQTFVNGRLFGDTYCYSENGNAILPCFIEQTLVTNDTSISNNSDLKVYRLFDTRNNSNRVISSGLFLDDAIQVCDNGDLTMSAGTIHFIIKPTGVEVHENLDTTCTKKIAVNGFSGNRNVKELKNGDYQISYTLEKKYFKTQVGQVEVERKQMQCDDTGRNPMKITKDGKSIYFKDVGNLIFFEYDCDKDGKKELYILNYFSCEGHLEIYKIV
jgi:antitoxin component YwqK of YwqJK toxin-antitoxin module